MAETITPVVHGGRRGRWGATVALHVVGASLSATAFGALLGAAGRLLGAPWDGGGALLVAAAAALYAAREGLGLPAPVPQARRQVPDWWRTFFSRPVFSFLYGTGLGVGFLTYLTRGTLVVVAVAAVASGRPLLGAALMAGFGLARGLTVMVSARVGTSDDGARLVDRLAERARSRSLGVLNAGALVLVGATAVADVIRTGSIGWAGLAQALLAAAFAWSAGSKLLRPRAWRTALAGHRLPARVERAAAVAVPWVEAAVVVSILAGRERAAGAVALVLLVAFSAAILRARGLVGNRVPCGCFGSSRAIDYRVVLGRNAALSIAAAVALGWGADGRQPASLPPITAEDAFPLMVAVLSLGVAGWTLWRGLSVLRPSRP